VKPACRRDLRECLPTLFRFLTRRRSCCRGARRSAFPRSRQLLWIERERLGHVLPRNASPRVSRSSPSAARPPRHREPDCPQDFPSSRHAPASKQATGSSQPHQLEDVVRRPARSALQQFSHVRSPKPATIVGECNSTSFVVTTPAIMATLLARVRSRERASPGSLERVMKKGLVGKIRSALLRFQTLGRCREPSCTAGRPGARKAPGARPRGAVLLRRRHRVPQRLQVSCTAGRGNRRFRTSTASEGNWSGREAPAEGQARGTAERGETRCLRFSRTGS